MAQTWPASLPQRALLEGYSEEIPKNTIRTSMDIGPVKRRRRTTANVRMFSFKLILTLTQVATLDTFYLTTCKDGTEAVSWVHPRTGDSALLYWTEEPTYSTTSDKFIANIKMEIRP